MLKRMFVFCTTLITLVSINAFAFFGSSDETFPNKPVTLIVPWPAGGVVDLMARNIATVSKDHLEQPVVVVNRTGGAGLVAFTQFAQEKPDGYNLQITDNSTFSLKPQLIDIKYSLDDYVPVIAMHEVELIMLVNPEKSGIQNFEQLMEKAKNNELIIGNSGEGDLSQLVEKAMMNSLGYDFEDVVYNGTIDIVNALVAGEIEVGVGFKGQMTEDYIRNGTLKPIVTFSANPIKGYAGVEQIPTMKDLGFDFMDGGLSFVYFLSARKGTPQEVIEKIQTSFDEIYADEEFERMRANLGYTMNPLKTEELYQKIDSESKSIKKMVDIVTSYPNQG